MTQTIKVSGSLKVITSDPTRYTDVDIRSGRTYPYETGVVVDESVCLDVDNGYVEAEVIPGAAVLVLFNYLNNEKLEIPLLIPEGVEEITLAEAIEGGSLLDEGDKSELEKITLQIVNDLSEMRSIKEKTSSSVSEASTHADSAKNAADRASVSEQNTSSSAAEAETYRDEACSSADTAQEAVKETSDHADRAEASAQEAGLSADTAKGYLDDFNKPITGERLAPELLEKIESSGGGVPEDHTHVVGDITGLQGLLDGKASVEHRHDISDLYISSKYTKINGVPERFNISGATWVLNYNWQKEPFSIVTSNHNGDVQVDTPVVHTDAVNKQYVDEELQILADKMQSLGGGGNSTLSRALVSVSRASQEPSFRFIDLYFDSDYSGIETNGDSIVLYEPGIYEITFTYAPEFETSNRGKQGIKVFWGRDFRDVEYKCQEFIRQSSLEQINIQDNGSILIDNNYGYMELGIAGINCDRYSYMEGNAVIKIEKIGEV